MKDCETSLGPSDALPWMRSPVYAAWLETHGMARLTKAWCQARAILHDIQTQLRAAGLLQAPLVLAVSGSIGRMEALSGSDLDLLIVVDDVNTIPDPSVDWHAEVWCALEPLRLPRPRSGGIFGGSVRASALLDRSTRGKLDESPLVYGPRIQWLLDAQVIGNAERGEWLREAILDWFHDDAEADDGWQFLRDELARYVAALHVRDRWRDRERPAVWLRRAVKLGYSRLVQSQGLLCLLGRSATSTPKSENTCAGRVALPAFQLTPLERVFLWGPLPSRDRVEWLRLYEAQLEALASHDEQRLREARSQAGRFQQLMSLRLD